MTVSTVQVTIAVSQITGVALPRGVVRFDLSTTDIDGAVVAQTSTTATLDDDGAATVSLWPNAAGTQGSQYVVSIYSENGQCHFNGVATVPETACNLHDILSLAAPAVVSDAQAAATSAQGYAARTAALPAAIVFTYDSTTADADPGAGKIRLNSTTLSSVTAAYVDITDAAGASVAAVLDMLDDSTATTKAVIALKEGSTSASAFYRLTGSVVDGTGYRKLTLTYIDGSSGGFTNGSAVGLSFAIMPDASSADPTAAIHAATSKAAPVDADELGLVDSAALWALKKLTWANLKATLKTYFDTLYLSIIAPGTFTPGFAFGGGSTGIVYSKRDGKYTKVGNCVTFRIDIVITTKGSSTGAWTVTGLPFTSAAGSGNTVFPAILLANATSGGHVAQNTDGTATLSLFQNSTGVPTALTDTAALNNSLVRISGTYFV